MNGLGRGQDQDGLIEELVRTDRLHQLFRQSFAAIFGSYLAAVMLCWLCWDRFDHTVMLVWLSVLAVTSLLRVQMFMQWFRCPNSERTPDRWERRYWVTLMLSAGVWGIGALAVMPTDDRVSQVLVMLFTVGMSVSAVSCYSAYRYMTLGSMVLVLFPCTLWLLFQPSSMQVGVGVAVLVFSTFVASATRKLADALEKAFRLTRRGACARAADPPGGVSARHQRVDRRTPGAGGQRGNLRVAPLGGRPHREDGGRQRGVAERARVPARRGRGGASKSVRQVVAVASLLLPRNMVNPRIEA